MNDINVMDYLPETETTNTLLYEVNDDEPIVTGSVTSFEVGKYLYIPYKIVEANEKISGDEVLKQFRLDGPAIDPSREIYTENRLRKVFDAIAI